MLSATDTPMSAAPGRSQASSRRSAQRGGSLISLARSLASCAMALALAAPAWADVSRDQAAAAAQRQTGGRVLSVDKTESGHRTVWRVKVVTPKGEVRVVFIDAGS